MAIARPGGSLPGKFPGSSKGRYSVHHMRDGSIVIQGPPRPRSKFVSGWKAYQQMSFAFIAGQTKLIDPKQRAAAYLATDGTPWTWRDVATMLMMGTFLEITLPDGTVLESAQLTQANPQYVLDLVTDLEGSILYRADIGWVGLGRAQDGRVLTLINGFPSWQEVSAGTIGGKQWSIPTYSTSSTTLFATKAAILQPVVDMQVTDLFFDAVLVAGASYSARLYTLSTNTISAILADKVAVTGAAGGRTALPVTLDAPVTLPAGGKYAVALSRTDATDTTSCGLNVATTDPSGVPQLPQSSGLVWAKKSPAVGDAGSSVATRWMCGERWG